MLKLSQLLDAKRRDSSDLPEPASRSIHSPGTANSSTPVSPAVSLFSTKGHARVSSSVSSLVSSPSHGNSMESATRNHCLTGVQEEPCAAGEARDLEQEYFRMFALKSPSPSNQSNQKLTNVVEHFDQGLSVVDNPYFSSVDHFDDYDLTDAGMDVPHSPKKRRSDSISGKGLSRISSHVSTMSNRWKSPPRRPSEDADGDRFFPDHWRSRTSSAASSALVSPTSYPISRVESTIPPSPARTIFEERLSESGVSHIDVAEVNRQFEEKDGESTRQDTTPLLPPFMGDDPMNIAVCNLNSPLQSPSVADIPDNAPLDLKRGMAAAAAAATMHSPPLSSKPSVTSFHHRPSASTMRTVSGDGPSPLFLSDPNDEWATKLGHANFTIQPVPYMPNMCTMETFHQLRTDWDLAQCNFAKHLVRTGEHYGITSNIYKLTEAKWDAINREWKRHHEAMLSQLEATQGPMLSLTKSNLGPCDQVKIPRLHDNKFPELGDGEIVGPMKIVPMSPRPSLKRSFLKFFQDLIGRS